MKPETLLCQNEGREALHELTNGERVRGRENRTKGDNDVNGDIIKPGGYGDRFGDYLCMVCVYVLRHK